MIGLLGYWFWSEFEVKIKSLEDIRDSENSSIWYAHWVHHNYLSSWRMTLSCTYYVLVRDGISVLSRTMREKELFRSNLVGFVVLVCLDLRNVRF